MVEKEYIEREAAIDAVCRCCPECFGQDICAEHTLMSKIPAADVVEVRHGKWSEVKCGWGIFDCYYFCSECHRHTQPNAFPIAPNYCPNCGAKMDGGNKNG